MSQTKIVIDHLARDAAHRTAAYLEQLFEPAPDAVTVFESHAESGGGNAPSWRIETYFSDLGDEQAVVEQMTACLEHSTSRPRLEAMPDINWVALSQAALPPVRAGRFTIFGSHDEHRIARGPNAIRIDAGEAFGTAHHATTFGCLLAIDRLARTFGISNALDLGCGSAVLSIALARALPDVTVLASDLDRQSVVVASGNIRTNRAATRVTALCANGFKNTRLRKATPFDLVIANILAGPLFGLAPDIATSVKPGGRLILSGILDSQARAIQARYVSLGFTLCFKLQINGWTTSVFLRRSSRPVSVRG